MLTCLLVAEALGPFVDCTSNQVGSSFRFSEVEHVTKSLSSRPSHMESFRKQRMKLSLQSLPNWQENCMPSMQT